jgi:hypothetical protein
LVLIKVSKFGDVAGTNFFVEICTIVTSNYGFKAGWKPLKYAAIHGHVAVLQILIETSTKCRAVELASTLFCGRDIWKCEVCCCTGERRWFFWKTAKPSPKLPGSTYKTYDVMNVPVERVADIRRKGVDGQSAWVKHTAGRVHGGLFLRTLNCIQPAVIICTEYATCVNLRLAQNRCL